MYDTIQTLRERLKSGGLDPQLSEAYGCGQDQLQSAQARLAGLLDDYKCTFGEGGAVGLFSAPGRTEMGGNHTDHQHGRVLTAAVDLDAAACAGINGTQSVRVFSKGYREVRVDLMALTPQPEEQGTSAALVRGIAARFREMGYPIAGFNACICSDVLSGSGLSSSAAFEVLIGVIFGHLFCGGLVDMVRIAQIGQYAENRFFGKPCGLMDQLTCAVGGVVGIDFADPVAPLVERLDCDLKAYGYTLCIIDSGADHVDLTDEYAAIPQEMGAAARFFGKSVLREVGEPTFWDQIPALRSTVGDRAVLRAIHFFTDNRLARGQAHALKNGEFDTFLQMVNQSGQSSAEHLQNLFCSATPQAQGVTVAIAAARHLLAGRGAVRVHGGGFAGTVQAYVPLEDVDRFRDGMEGVLGKGCCHYLEIRSVGGVRLA